MKLLFCRLGISAGLWIWMLLPGCVISAYGQLNTLTYAEKIYLQTDSEVYTPGTNIWFKAIVLAGAAHQPTQLSGVLYVELISPGGELLISQLIRLQEGVGAGTLALDPDLAGGTYLLRAYTRWSQNFNDDFIYEKQLAVFTARDVAASPGEQAEVIPNADVEGSRLRILLNPLALDSLHRGRLDVGISLDGVQDSIRVRQQEGDRYVLEYPLTKDSKVLSLGYRTDSGKHQFETIALDTAAIDLQFFPEGGTLVAGIPSQLGFKAIGYDGLGRKVSGTVTDQNGTVLSTFKSNALGMGSFRLRGLSDTLSYFAEVARPGGAVLKLALPEIKTQGSSLALRDLGAGLQAIVLSNAIPNDSIQLQVHSRGRLYYEIKEPLQKGMLAVVFPVSKLPFGILEISLSDSRGVKMARRLWFNHNTAQSLQIDVDLEKERYATREQVRFPLQISDGTGKPKPASASVLVAAMGQLGMEPQYRESILSYFLLQSELRGTVEKPGFYFQKDSVNTAAIDDLLLTQGWVRYNYDTIPAARRFLPEPVLLLEGSVSAPLNKSKRREGVQLALMSFDETLFIQEQESDSLGRFSFNIDALSGGYQNLLIQTSKESGKNKDYNLNLKQPQRPSVELAPKAQFALADRTLAEAAQQRTEQQRVLREAIPFGDEDIALDEVLVNSYKMTPKRQEVADEYGMPDVVIDGKAIQAKEKKWSYGLYSVLLFSFPDKIRIVRDSDGVLKAQVRFSDTTLVLVDGIPVMGYNYDMIPNLPVSMIESFEIIEMASNFTSLYLEAYPNASPLEAPSWGHVIAIYTYGGNGLFAAERPKGIVKQRVQVFSEPEAFYTPKYETQQDLNTTEPDLRSTVFWEPEVAVSETGKGEVAFYNPDNTGTMYLVVEAVSAEGQLGYTLMRYEIVDRDDP